MGLVGTVYSSGIGRIKGIRERRLVGEEVRRFGRYLLQ